MYECREKKQKTLYGRYDDYDLPGSAADDISEGIAQRGVDPVGHTSRAVRLCDLDAKKHPDMSGQRPPCQQCPSPPAISHRDQTVEKAPAPTPAGIWAITHISPAEEGAFLLISLEGRAEDGTRIRRKIPVTVEQYADLGLQVGELSKTRYNRLVEAGLYCRAIRKGMELLGYGDLSVRRLVWKLTARGVDKATAEAAADYLSMRGYLTEETAARQRAVQGVRKQWGPRRILQDLRAQGYTDEAVVAAMETLSGGEDPSDAVDFEAMCASLIRKKYGHVPEDGGERQRMVAALMRMGYTADQIREAIRCVTDS